MKEKGFTLDGAKAKMKEPIGEEIDKEKVIASLTKIKSFLKSLKLFYNPFALNIYT